jgi:SAM-dependent methyltransferase
MDSLPFESEFESKRWEYVEIQESGGISALEDGRLRATVGMIPRGVATILEVGSGDGRIIHRLAGDYRQVVGIDHGYGRVRNLGKNGVCATSTQLPFPDHSFDLVLCCEVLEHLHDDVLSATVAELARVSRKYILVSVPFKENLQGLLIKCPECQTIFHAWGHVRTFSNRDLDKLFESFRTVSRQFFGKRAAYFNQFVLRMNQRFGNRWAESSATTMCPRCGNTQFRRTGRNIVTIVCGIVNLLTSTLVPVSNRNWIFKLYTRK